MLNWAGVLVQVNDDDDIEATFMFVGPAAEREMG